eukprot:scaffold4420_cov135-Skeletonema_dohrnii-CCMP3373.AAC.1
MSTHCLVGVAVDTSMIAAVDCSSSRWEDNVLTSTSQLVLKGDADRDQEVRMCWTESCGLAADVCFSGN